MKIISLEASNVKRLRAVTITPEGNTVVIGGKNGAGKSSILDSITAALGGKKLCPKVPIRRGQESAEVTVDLGDLVITRRWTQADSRLIVTNADGARYQTPQAILGELFEQQTIDPVAFSRATPAEQLEIVRQLVGLDLSKFDAEHAKVYAERRDLNREVKRTEAELDRLPEDPDAPAAEVAIADLVAELEKAQAKNTANAAARRILADDEKQRVALNRRLSALHDEIAEVQREQEELRERMAKHQREVEGLEDVDESPLRAQIAGAEDANRRARAAQQRAAVAATLDDLRKQSRGMTARLTEIETKKREAIAAAEYPIEGLALGDDGLLLNGLPFEQASSAEQLRVSVAIGLALNPKLRVLLIRDGSLLDEDSLALVAQAAEEADAQVWIERVGEGGASVVIEDGAVREDGGVA